MIRQKKDKTDQIDKQSARQIDRRIKHFGQTEQTRQIYILRAII